MSLVFRHEERESQFLLCWPFLHRPQPTPSWTRPAYSQISTNWPNERTAHPVAPSWTGLAQSQISTNWPNKRASHRPSWTARPRIKISTEVFFEITKFPVHLFRAIVIHTPVQFPIWGFYYDICDCHIHCARAWTVFNVCTCTCTKPNSSESNQTEW